MAGGNNLDLSILSRLFGATDTDPEMLKFTGSKSDRFKKQLLQDYRSKEINRVLMALLAGEDTAWMNKMKEAAAGQAGGIRRGVEGSAESLKAALSSRGGGSVASVGAFAPIQAAGESQVAGLRPQALLQGAQTSQQIVKQLMDFVVNQYSLVAGLQAPTISGQYGVEQQKVAGEYGLKEAMIGALGRGATALVGG